MLDSSHVSNINIVSEKVLSSPEEIKAELPLTDSIRQFVFDERNIIANIIKRRDTRLLVICGPCSIHDVASAHEYAERLLELRKKYAQTMHIVMRVYFEKPRTTVGWKGYINDPHIDNSFDIEYGLRKARSLLLWLNDMGLSVATEALDPISPQYVSELISWAAIGARTTESQTHREMASGLSMPVGFKNGTDGGLETAINGIKAASSPQVFMGINQQGRVVLLSTRGNHHCHIVLRGGVQPNYDEKSIHDAQVLMESAGLNPSLLIDCSHGNSNKDYKRQPLVAQAVIEQVVAGNRAILGLMLESHLYEGNQSSNQEKGQMKYGVSITDACIDWHTTADLLAQFHRILSR